MELLVGHLQQAAILFLQLFRVMLGDSHHPALFDRQGRHG